MLTIFRRHTARCMAKRPEYDRTYRKCKCLIHVEGKIGDRFLRESLKTRSWEQANRRVAEAEARGTWEELPEQHGTAVPAHAGENKRVTVAHAVAEYLQNAKDQGNGEDTLRKKATTFEKQLLTWCEERGYFYIEQLGTSELRQWRSTWNMEPLARSKRQGMVCGFFYFCMRQGWITKNPMLDVGKIQVRERPTDYFPKEEFDAIIDATYLYRGDRWENEDRFGERLRTLTLLMRWSGLAIRDAITLERSRLVDDSVLLYRAKTGHPVYVPLPPDVACALRDVPPGKNPHPAYFFWSGRGKPKSAVADWQRSYRRLFELAAPKLPVDPQTGKTKRCHPHMFRDTFAVEMLLAGVPIEQVSMLLGHKSVKTTEKSYLPWVHARQKQLEESVRRAWLVQVKPDVSRVA
jgi:integrase/recombinase XerD